ncbi:hypothetical protein CVT24_008084 [Panaeolus cyanescens]|uniref:Uncharacterized protein n=1 Tax=Panaeolus cyanescens TaxID=181874 RepID=A0A409W0P9_9AGAR|nr:hypothetical protein CVT24_008084 [Panaeolus cyanescens]
MSHPTPTTDPIDTSPSSSSPPTLVSAINELSTLRLSNDIKSDAPNHSMNKGINAITTPNTGTDINENTIGCTNTVLTIHQSSNPNGFHCIMLKASAEFADVIKLATPEEKNMIQEFDLTHSFVGRFGEATLMKFLRCEDVEAVYEDQDMEYDRESESDE